MRDYGKISPQFWTGKTGKAIKSGGPESVVVAMYLMSSPHSNMIGMYYLPMMYLAHETGLGIEGASKGLQRACEAGFCSYDEASEVVWVHEMARYQIADELSEKDNQVKGIQREYDSAPENPFKSDFYDRYSAAFKMKKRGEIASPLQAPSKPLRSQEQEQEQEQESRHKQQRGSRLPADWTPDDVGIQFCKTERPDLDPAKTADRFRDYWISQPGTKGVKLDWTATWRNWVRNESKAAQRSHTESNQPLCNPDKMPPGLKMSSHGAYL